VLRPPPRDGADQPAKRHKLAPCLLAVDIAFVGKLPARHRNPPGGNPERRLSRIRHAAAHPGRQQIERCVFCLARVARSLHGN
jgi:hypothetical protein